MWVALQRGRETATAQGEPDVPRPEQVLDVLAYRSLETFIGSLDAHDDLGDRQHVLEVDENRRDAFTLRALEHPAQQRRLSVPARTDQPKGMAALGERQQIVSLRIPIDHVLWRERPGEPEGVEISATRHALSLAYCLQ